MKKKLTGIIIAILVLTSGISYAQQTVLTVTRTEDPDPYIYDNNPDDTAIVGTLQWALRKANDTADSVLVNFNIQGTIPHIIYLNYYLPSLNNRIIIDGTTQSGYSRGNPTIIIDGQHNILSGIVIHSPDCEIHGLYIRNFLSAGIEQEGNFFFKIQDNVINQINDTTNTNESSGILIINNTTGGIIQGNIIGTDITNSIYLGNKDNGICLFDSRNIIIGGADANESNIIAYNNRIGINLASVDFISSSSSALITRNKIYNNPYGIYIRGRLNFRFKESFITVNDTSRFIAGATNPNLFVEIFGSTGNENANEYITTVIADSLGYWETQIDNTGWDYLTAISVDFINKITTEISYPVQKTNYQGIFCIQPAEINIGALNHIFGGTMYDMGTKQFWLKFTAETPDVKIEIAKSFGAIIIKSAIADIKKAYFYKGSCDSLSELTFIDSIDIAVGDTVVIEKNNLTLGETYYIKLEGIIQIKYVKFIAKAGGYFLVRATREQGYLCSDAVQTNATQQGMICEANEYDLLYDHYWLQLYPNSQSMDIMVIPPLQTPESDIRKIALYSGECDNLTEISNKEINAGDSVFISYDYFSNDSSYYIKVERIDTIPAFINVCIKSNAGKNCDAAQQLPSPNTSCYTSNYTITGNEHWFNFNAEYQNMTFDFTIPADSPAADIQRLYLYTGVCDNLEQLQVKDINNGDSLKISVNDFVLGQTYYIKAEKDDINTGNFLMCVTRALNQGENCMSAEQLPEPTPDGETNDYRFTGTEYWYKFIPPSKNIEIRINPSTQTPEKNIYYFEIYKGDCENLEFIGYKDIYNGDSLWYSDSTFIPGMPYYLYLNADVFDEAWFSIYIKSEQINIGSTCTAAIPLPPATYTCSGTNLQITDTVFWMSFTADTSSMRIAIENPTDTPAANIQKLILYNGNCGTLQEIARRDINAGELLDITKTDFVVGETYLAKAVQDEATSGWFGVCNARFIQSTKLQEQYCGSNLITLAQTLRVVVIPNAIDYSFLISNDSLDFSYTYHNSTGDLILPEIQGLYWATTYNVTVKAIFSDFEGEYGEICQFTTVMPSATPMLIEKRLNEDPQLQQQIDSYEQIIQNIINNQGKAITDKVIPVVFHVISPNIDYNGDGTIDSDDAMTYMPVQRINDQLDILNAAFNGTYNQNGNVTNNSHIRFCLARNRNNQQPVFTTLDGIDLDGITYHIDNSLTQNVTNHNILTQQASLMAFANLTTNTAFPVNRYLNIWIVNSIIDSPDADYTIVGYSPMPDIQGINDPMNGVVMNHMGIGTNWNADLTPAAIQYTDFFAGWEAGTTLTHEIGHYLNLWHPWNGGCTSAIGDYCPDTNPQDQELYDCPATGYESCTGFTAPKENYMNYTTDFCRFLFTTNQVERQHACLEASKATLFSNLNLVNAGLVETGCISATLDPTFIADNTQICLGNNVSLTFVSGTATSCDWIFENLNTGTILTSTQMVSPLIFNLTETGPWSIILSVNDGSNPLSNIQSIYVDDCSQILTTPEQGNWYFSDRAALNFQNWLPQQVVPDMIDGVQIEGCATISDNNGNLLFYTNGISVWNGTLTAPFTHAQITNQLNSVGTTPTQGALIVPDPGDANRYYIFTVSGIEDFGIINNGLCYTIIDMSIPNPTGGMGRIANDGGGIPILNIPVSPNMGSSSYQNNIKTTEHLNAIPNCDNTGYWILVHGADIRTTDNQNLYDQLLSYELTSTGINNNPVISQSFLVPVIPIGNNYVGQIKIAPNGKRIAITHLQNNTCYLYDFNKSTGLFSLQIAEFINSVGYSLSFSPNSKILYLYDTDRIQQINLETINNCNQNVEIYNIPKQFALFCTMQIAPNEKIYFAARDFPFSKTLACINYPDIMCSISNPNACGFNEQAFTLSDYNNNFVFAKLGLPNMIDAKTGIQQPEFDFCAENCYNYHFHNLSCGNIFLWDFGDGTFSNLENPIHTFTTPGLHTITLTVDNNNFTSHDINIVNPTCNISGSSQICFGINHSSYNATNFNPDFQYSWNPIGGIAGAPNSYETDISWNIEATDHFAILTVTDENGCQSTCSLTVVLNTEIVLELTTDIDYCSYNTNCNGTASATVTGGIPPYLFSWSNNQNISNISNLCSNNYSVTITDNAGCSVTDNITVLASYITPLTLTTTTINVLCNGSNSGEINLNVSGGSIPYSYLWSDGQTTVIANNLEAGTYTVTVTDANNCTTNTSIVISQPSEQLIASNSFSQILCNGDYSTVTVSATGGTGTYTGTGIYTVQAGNYSITITDENNCSATTSANITQPTALTASVNSQTNISCSGLNDGTATITATGGTSGYTYLWNTIPPQTSVTATALAAGYNAFTVTDNNGCQINNYVDILTPLELSVNFYNVQNTSCYSSSDGEVSVNAQLGTLPYTYQWNTIPVQTTNTATGLTAGNYEVTVTDFNGCEKVGTVSIFQPSELMVNIVTTDVSCNGITDGKATITVSGGTPNYNILWNTVPPQTSATATNLAAGSYTVTVTDENSCAIITNVNITQPDILSSAINISTNVSCNGGTNGTATVTVSGGTPGYTYAWTPSGGTSATAIGLSPNNYWVLITDNNDCNAVANVIITQPSAITTIVTQTNASCNGSSDGSATLIVSGGVSPYAYSWNTIPLQTSSTAINLSDGVYTVTVTDANLCTATASVTITEPLSVLTVTTSVTNSTCSDYNNGLIMLTVNGGTSPYQFLWSNNLISQNITNLSPGLYSVTVTDANLCKVIIDNIQVTEPTVIDIIPSITSTLCYGSCDGSISLNVSGGTPFILPNPPYTYIWSNSQITSSISGLCIGIYDVTVTDANGCIGHAAPTVGQPTQISVNVTPTNVLCNGGNNGGAVATVSGGTPPYTYTWSGGTAGTFPFQIINLSAGTYTVTVYDANNCSITSMFVITQPQPLVITVTGVTATCPHSCDGQAIATVTGGTSSYQYNWSNGETTQQATSLCLDNIPPQPNTMTFTVTVTDFNNCQVTGSITLTIPFFNFYLNSATNNNVLNYPAYFGFGSGTAVVNNKRIYIEGSFHVNRDLTLNNCNILMADNAEIYVEHKKTLTLNRTNISACSDMWNRIYLQTIKSSLYIKNTFGLPNAIISRAITAVDADNKAFFNISDATFQDNLTSIFVHSWTGNGLNIYPGTIKNTKFFNTNYSISRGIWLQGTDNNNREFDLDLGGNTFENFRWAILSENVSLKIKNCNFTNSLFGISASNLPAMQTNNIDIRLCNFIINNSFPSSQSPTGVKIKNVRNINIRSSKALFNGTGTGFNIDNQLMPVTGGLNDLDYSTIQSCTLNMCTYGVYTYANQHIDVKNSIFTNNENGIFSYDIRKMLTVKTNTFTNNNYGVFATNIRNVHVSNQNVFNGHKSYSNPAYTAVTIQNIPDYLNGSAKIFNNTYSNVYNGVKLTNLPGSNVTNEVITLYPLNSEPLDNTLRPAGIRLEACSNGYIQNNIIDGTNSWLWWTSGIRLQNTTGYTLNNNTVKNIGLGLSFGGGVYPSTLTCNTMQSNTVGLFLEWVPTTGIGQQGGLNVNSTPTAGCPVNDNQWTGTFNEAHTKTYWSQGLSSPLNVRSEFGLVLPYVPTLNYVDPFLTGFPSIPADPTDATPFSLLYTSGCSSICSGSIPIPLALTLEQQIASNQVNYKVNPDANRWLAKNYVYRKLKKDPQLLNSNPVFIPFMDSLAASNSGLIYNINEILNDSVGQPNLVSVSNFNNSISPVNTIELNHQSINAIYLFILNHSIDSLSQSQLIELRKIASSCPYTDGNAVFSARVILSLIDTVVYFNDCENAYNGPINNSQKSMFNNLGEKGAVSSIIKQETVQVYPNPTKGELTISFQLNGNGVFELYDIFGKKIYSSILDISEINKTISLEFLPDGVYYFKAISEKGNIVNTDKIILIN